MKKYQPAAYLYIIPALVIYAIFFLFPIFQLIRFSFTRWSGVGPKKWVGLLNYKTLLFHDQMFWYSTLHNLLWLVAALIIPVSIGLFLAILLVRAPLHGRRVFRVLYFMPQVLSSVVVAVIWRWIYNPVYGALNMLLKAVGLSFLAQGWLGNYTTALPALFVAWSWKYFGFCMVIFIAALQEIGEEYFEAAKLDGANWFQQLKYIILPFITNPMRTVLIITMILSVQIFDLVYIITHGGPGNSTMVASLYMYDNAFKYGKIGYGSTVAIVLGLIILGFSIISLRLRKEANK